MTNARQNKTHPLKPILDIFLTPHSFELPQTTRNQEIATKVDLLLTEAEALGIESRLITRRQARKMLQGRGTLRTAMLTERSKREQAK